MYSYLSKPVYLTLYSPTITLLPRPQLRLFSYPIHLFNVYVPPIRFSSSDSRPKSFSPFLLPSSPTTYIFGDFNSHHSSWDSHSPEDHSGKNLFDWLLSSDLLPLNNPEHHTLLHRATGNRFSPDLSLVPARIALNAHGRPFQTSALIIFLSLSLFPLLP